MEKVITDEKFKLLVEKLCEEFDVYAPCVSGNYSEFTQIKHFNECDFNILNTTRPLKHLFLPQTEKLFTVMGEGDNLKLETCPPLKKKRIILGAKSCEVKGVELLSNIYSIGACKDEL
ncbi:hypothetical protein HY745_02650, partial [Candidatus Desantisbacteria bacterium]|nr:hypothetical protein [Candidatus Desantisbacteria bacterium]